MLVTLIHRIPYPCIKWWGKKINIFYKISYEYLTFCSFFLFYNLSPRVYKNILDIFFFVALFTTAYVSWPAISFSIEVVAAERVILFSNK